MTSDEHKEARGRKYNHACQSRYLGSVSKGAHWLAGKFTRRSHLSPAIMAFLCERHLCFLSRHRAPDLCDMPVSTIPTRPRCDSYGFELLTQRGSPEVVMGSMAVLASWRYCAGLKMVRKTDRKQADSCPSKPKKRISCSPKHRKMNALV